MLEKGHAFYGSCAYQHQSIYVFIFFFLLRFFLMWTILKIFIEFVTMLPLFYVVFFFGWEACGISAPRPGIKPAPLASEGEVLTLDH